MEWQATGSCQSGMFPKGEARPIENAGIDGERMRILGQYFLLPKNDQFDIKDRLSARPGVHVISGPNNSGKTRLLQALEQARLTQSIDVDELQRLVPGLEETIHGRYNNLNFGWDATEKKSITLSWSRGAEQIHYEPDSERLKAAMAQVGFNPTGLATNLAARPFCRVQTNRYFSPISNITNAGPIEDLQNSITYLENLRTGVKTRDTYTKIQIAFHDIAEGLEFDTYQGGSNTLERTLYIKERDTPGPGREIGFCGDGLRDLILLVAYAISHPLEDLLLDEPGLRLHARTQRRLIAFLNEAAKTHEKAIYIATHDEAILNSPLIDGRYFVRREPPKSVVRGIEDGRAIWGALRELGTEPSRLLGHSGIIVCEGPSDVTVFSMILDWICETSPEAGFFAVEHLEGDGNIVKQHKRIFEVLRRAMPFGDIAVVLDRTGSTSPGERRAFGEYCEKNSIHQTELSGGDLEDYFTPAIFEGVLDAMGFSNQKPAVLVAISEAKGLARFERASEMLGSRKLKDKRQIASCVATLDRRLLERELKPLVTEIQNLVRATIELSRPHHDR